MRHALEVLIAKRIASGLRRKAITRCSKWAETYRVMGPPYPGPWTLKHHPWLRKMLDCTDQNMCGQKAAQMGFTEVAMNLTFYTLDVLGSNVLYILPSQTPDASDFSASRLDPALELSPHLEALFTDRKNVGHKRAGMANLFVRGSRTRSQLKSVPVSLVIKDEVDEMDQKNLTLIPERMSGQIHKQIFGLSTPTHADVGINVDFKLSSRDEYKFKCPCCNRWTELIYPDSLVITASGIMDPRIRDSHYICHLCKGVLEHEAKINWLTEETAEWFPQVKDAFSTGFAINQMYSFTVSPLEFAQQVFKAEGDLYEEQELWNSKLGLPHEVKGARVTDSDISRCMGTYQISEHAPSNALVTMGVDVGAKINYEIDQYWWDDADTGTDINVLAKAKLLAAGEVNEFEELDNLMRDYRVMACVIDANPEKRKAYEFALRFWGHVWLCYYAVGVTSRRIKIHDEDEHTISVDRTSWLDMSLGRVKKGNIRLPVDLPLAWKSHLKVPGRIYKKDQWGNPVGMYVKGSKPDHYAHARNYAEIALPFAVSIHRSCDIEDLL